MFFLLKEAHFIPPRYGLTARCASRGLREVYPYFHTYAILERYADLRRTLRPPHGKELIGDIDTLIAATAIERNLTLLTADRDFDRVPHLKLKLVNLKI